MNCFEKKSYNWTDLFFFLPLWMTKVIFFCHFLQISSNGAVMDKIDKWLTIDEVVDHIKMSRTKLYGIAQRGEIPASKIVTQWRFDREEINQWMKAYATGKGNLRV